MQKVNTHDQKTELKNIKKIIRDDFPPNDIDNKVPIIGEKTIGVRKLIPKTPMYLLIRTICLFLRVNFLRDAK